jgi:hypothetical protein
MYTLDFPNGDGAIAMENTIPSSLASGPNEVVPEIFSHAMPSVIDGTEATEILLNIGK